LVNINELAHVILTVAEYDKSHQFYMKILPAFGMTLVHDGPDFCYHAGARTALGIKKCDPEFQKEQFQQYRAGLHHLSFRTRSREDVDKTAKFLIGLGAKVVRHLEVRECAPRYYFLFEGPDSIRLKASFLPGTYFLENGANFGAGGEFIREDGEDLTVLFHQSTSMSRALQTMKFATA